MIPRLLAVAVAVAMAPIAYADQEQLSRLHYTSPEGWQHSVDGETKLGSLAPPGGGASVTFSPSTEFAGTAEQWQHEMWSGILGEMKLAGPSQPGVQAGFLTRMGVFNKADGTHPWVCLYTLVQDGRGEGVVFFAAGEKEFFAHLGTVNHMIHGITVAALPADQGAISAGNFSPPAGAGPAAVESRASETGDSEPVLRYAEPADFLRGGGTSPLEYSSREVSAAVQVYAFRPFTGDLRAVFQQTLLRDWIGPQFRETALAAPPVFAVSRVPGASLVLTARFHENVAGLPNERMRMLVAAGNWAAIVDLTANSAYSWEKAGASLRPMLDSLRVERKAGAPSMTGGPGPGGAALAGLYLGTKSKYVVNLQRGVGYGDTKLASHYYLFSADGRVYCCYDFPPGGDDSSWKHFNFDAAQRDDPANTGRYTVRGNQFIIQMSEAGAEAITGAIRDKNSLEIETIKYVREQ
jgi:hypothetical protein